MTLEETMQKIRPVDVAAMAAAKQHWDGLGKPLGSLGRLEKALIQIAGIQRTGDVHIDRKALVIMCADNGVVEEGVTQCGQEVTATVAENFLDEKSCVAIMCRRAGTKICPVDIGMAVDTPRVEKRKIAYGTKNMAKEPAMTREQAVAAIEVGIAKAEELHAQGYEMLATGEMGIGNTTTSSAMTAVYLGLDVETVTGRGAGLSSHGLQRKIHAIKQAIAVNQPDYILASHVSEEPGANILLKALEKDAFLTCGMRLGEGSGAVALFPILDFASDIYHKMSTFVQADIVEYQPLD